MERYIISDNVAVSNVEGCYIVLNLDTSIYYTMEKVAYDIFNCLKNDICTIDEITQKICEIYDVDNKMAKNDIEELLLKCVDQGLVCTVKDGGK